MNQRALLEKALQPTDEMLEDALGRTYKYYTVLIKLTGDFDKKWTFYKGWSLKIFDKKKALLYMVPHEDGFIVSMAIREKEKETLLENPKLDFAHNQLNESEKIMEGYVIQFEVEQDESAQKCFEFVEALIGMR
ncbi:MAG: hypothetical protein CVU95_12180 [Firmicutes bacterium HGW-Firmicutes-2]|jgi:hypothetical protein|nr:MAG: hypothetical protein CVU95_12180 [Firmicutes bacterium HGW-Firmicutes-2]